MDVTPFRVRSGDAELAGVRFGSGPPLVVAHPLAFSKAYFAAAASVLGPRFTTVAFDQRGHGETEGPVDPDAMAGDWGAILDHFGWERAAVGGTSLGAATALRFALRSPGRVRILVQDLPGFGPRPRRDPVRTQRVAEALERADLEEAARRIVEGMSPPRARAWQEALRADWGRYDPARLGPKLAAAFRATADWPVVDPWPDALAGLTAPVRILAVRGDPSHPWEIAETLARALPRARLVPRVLSLDPAAIARQWVDVLSLE